MVRHQSQKNKWSGTSNFHTPKNHGRRENGENVSSRVVEDTSACGWQTRQFKVRVDASFVARRRGLCYNDGALLYHACFVMLCARDLASEPCADAESFGAWMYTTTALSGTTLIAATTCGVGCGLEVSELYSLISSR